MENASKALIIAGAILLAILLISLGILIYNQAQDTVNGNGMSQAEISAFNNKFLKYEGDNQKGTVVKSMINEVIVNNAENSRKIKVKIGSGSEATDSPNTEGIVTSDTYKVKLNYKDGVVDSISVWK